MSDERFTEPETTREDWVDVRMTNPEEGEWDVDAVVVGGRVEYVDLRIRPDPLLSFLECLLDDVADERARAILDELATRVTDVPDDAPFDEERPR